MNFKVGSTIVLTLFCILQISYAIKCYQCDSETSCKKAKKIDCNQVYANETMKFLDTLYLNVNTNTASNIYKCLRQDLKVSTGTIKYKGCIYNHVNGCGYSLRPYYQQGSTTSDCFECNKRDGCNPANRNSLSLLALALPVIFAALFKFWI